MTDMIFLPEKPFRMPQGRVLEQEIPTERPSLQFLQKSEKFSGGGMGTQRPFGENCMSLQQTIDSRKGGSSDRC